MCATNFISEQYTLHKSAKSYTSFTKDEDLVAIKKLNGYNIPSFTNNIYGQCALSIICACIIAPYLVFGKQQDFAQYLKRGIKRQSKYIVLMQFGLIWEKVFEIFLLTSLGILCAIINRQVDAIYLKFGCLDHNVF